MPEEARYRKAKIVATLGPATSSTEMVERLITAGVNVVRLNLSHGTIDDHRRMIATVKEVSTRLAAPVGILLDLQGPRIRTGALPGKALKLEAGQKISIAPEGSDIEGPYITTNYTALAGDVRPGARVLIDDGLVELRVEGVRSSVVDCEVVYGGTVGERKGMNLPGVDVSAPSLTEKDMEGVALAVESCVDYMALSFVRRAADVAGLKRLLAERGAEIPVIAKIERAEAVENLTEVLDASGEGVPGVEALVIWDEGQDRFFTGLKPELGLGYADFTMEPGTLYSLQLRHAALPITNLSSAPCEAEAGESYPGSLQLTFQQPATP